MKNGHSLENAIYNQNDIEVDYHAVVDLDSWLSINKA